MRACLLGKVWPLAVGLWLAIPTAAAAQQAEQAVQQADPATTHAQPVAKSSLRVALLRTTQGATPESASAIDGVLLRDLAALAGIENPTVSPIDYAEIQLTVGCSDEGIECLASIAKMVEVDAVVVRKLSAAGGKSTLALLYFDATVGGQPARAEQGAEGATADETLRAAVPVLVRQLFGIPEPVVAAESEAPTPQGETGPAREPTQNEGGGVGTLTWVTLVAGAGVLTAGLVVGASAQSGFDDYQATKIATEDDLTRANAIFDKAESKGLVATILIPSGAALLALGATLLIFDLSSEDSGEPELALWPVRGGAMLSVSGEMGGL